MINDKFEPQKILANKIKKLKGHVKLTLKNAETGEIEKVVEGENIVTNALPDLIENNVFGCLDFNEILPLWSKWFNGCLLFQEPFPEDEGEQIDPNNYFIKDDTVEKLIAHAGDEFTSDTGDDPKRGMPNTALQVKNPHSITLAWSFLPNIGNGEIASIALCHKDVGNAGTGRNSNAFKALDPIAWISKSNLSTYDVRTSQNTVLGPTEGDRIMGQLDEHTKFYVNVGDHNDEFITWYGTDPNGGTHDITAWITSMGITEVGLQDAQHGRKVHWITHHHGGFTWWHQPAYSWDAKNKNVWLFANEYVGLNESQTRYVFKRSPDWVQVMKIHFSKNENDEWYSSASYHVIYPDAKDVGFLDGKGGMLHQQKDISNNQYQDIVYLPYVDPNTGSEDNTKKIKFNLQNQADISYVTNLTTDPYLRFCGPNDGDLLVGLRGVCNSGYCYRANTAYNDYNNYISVPMSPNSISSLALGERSYDTRCRWIAANKMVKTTMFNLPETVMKTTAQTMILEYTLTEVDEDGES